MDYSPTGQVYTEASDAFREVFSTGQPLVEGPVPDVWGNRVIALVSISKANPAIPNAVLGIDVDARDWTRNILIRTAPVVTLTLLLLASPIGAADGAILQAHAGHGLFACQTRWGDIT